MLTVPAPDTENWQDWQDWESGDLGEDADEYYESDDDEELESRAAAPGSPAAMSEAENLAALHAAAGASLHCVIAHSRGLNLYKLVQMGPAGVVVEAVGGERDYILFRQIEWVHVRVPT